MKNRFLLLVLLLLPLQFVYGQGKADFQQQYLQAKRLYEQERWEQAMEAFRRLTSEQKNNSFVEYASFYYALSAIQAERFEEARAMLQQIRRKHAGWDQQDEVNYWLAHVYLREQSYRQAVDVIQREIQDRRIKADAGEMAANYLRKEEDIDLLRQLLREYPDAQFLARVIARKISSQPAVDQDRVYLEELVSRYSLNEELLNQPDLGETVKKDEYRVAVMLPFLHNELQPEANLHKRYFILDLYEGMKIAQEELLEQQQIKLRLHAYDTRRDSLATRRLLNAPEMRKMDLIVGPLFPAPSKLASEFSLNQGINMVNPLSVNPELIRNNPYTFLLKPSLITQGRKAAEFAAKTFENQSAVIVYGPKERDSIMAHSYKRAIEQEGFTVRIMAKVPAGEETSIRQLLVPGDKEEDLKLMQEGGRLHRDTLGHVFVASEDELIIANALTAIMNRGDRLPMIGHESWLRMNFVSFEQLERLGVYFVAPEYIDYASENFLKFREKYMARVNYMPTRYAYIGYDLVKKFGSLMAAHGNLFQKGLTEERVPANTLSPCYSFVGSNDNQCVPIVRFRDSALEVVYQ